MGSDLCVVSANTCFETVMYTRKVWYNALNLLFVVDKNARKCLWISAKGDDVVHEHYEDDLNYELKLAGSIKTFLRLQILYKATNCTDSLVCAWLEHCANEVAGLVLPREF